ncbi:OmpH family outer membrane protein [Paenalcaligenes suwonensis]|uniref:OmpH family outer membrane protein n=1 Tax=Paenalcaligenes suwonensis TaxID=1202713 RepID=UPI00140DE0B4|nr:OmpH family outer membrane protein [Paenalcaligenes suwonensis]NHC62289.1 OmpH family outer membrane protein [Paenalcaligenes suwonensis]
MSSKFAFKLSAVGSQLVRRNRTALMAAVLGVSAVVATPVVQAQTKIGFVSTERILRDSKPALAAQQKIESEFKRRDDELQRLANQLRDDAVKFDKDAPVMSETDRIRRERQLTDMDADLQRKRREFQEDFNRRRNEEFSAIVEKADAAIQRIAETQGYDLIIQDAVTVNPRVDITEEVLTALGN